MGRSNINSHNINEKYCTFWSPLNVSKSSLFPTSSNQLLFSNARVSKFFIKSARKLYKLFYQFVWMFLKCTILVKICLIDLIHAFYVNKASQIAMSLSNLWKESERHLLELLEIKNILNDTGMTFGTST